MQLNSEEMLGAIDIVEAFTALRQELKLQVRSGRELQQTLDQRLTHLESQLAEQAAHSRSLAATITHPTADASPSDAARTLAEALAEVEEHLERAVQSLHIPAPISPNTALRDFDRHVAQASWLSRWFSRGLLVKLRAAIETEEPSQDPQRERLQVMRQGLELLLARVRRLMQGCGLERRDVLHRPFDAETMRAIDVIVAANLPSSHVAEQLRPLYLWQGRVLKFADVRLAK